MMVILALSGFLVGWNIARYSDKRGLKCIELIAAWAVCLILCLINLMN